MKTLYPLCSLLFASCVMTSAGTPGQLREVVMRDTATAPYGSLGVELGGHFDPGDRQSIPLRMEYGYRETMALFLDVEAYEKISRPGNDGEGFGDLGLGLRDRFWESSVGTSSLFEARVVLPTGGNHDGLGAGGVDFYAATTLSQSFEEVLLSTWVELGILGDVLDSGTEMQRTVAGAAAVNLGESLLGFGELEQTFGDALDPASGRLGVAWRTPAATTIDVGLSLGLNDDAPDGVAFFVGFSSNLGLLGPSGPDLTSTLEPR